MAQTVTGAGVKGLGPLDLRSVRGVCVALSILLHITLLIVFQETFPLKGLLQPLKTYRVDLYRPPVDAMDRFEEAGADLTSMEGGEEAPQEAEDTISLDTEDERYSSYAGLIKSRLMQHWRYPLEARENLMEGRLQMIFRLDRQGQLLSAGIVTASGFDILDQEALRAIRAAAPYPPFPGSVTVSKLNIKADFDYRLTSRKKGDEEKTGAPSGQGD
jgi:TonB family protein